MEEQNCIFCKIASNKIPANIIIENEKAIAFLDAFPLVQGHTLVIPKHHYSKIQDMNPDYSNALFEVLWRITDPIEKAVGVTSSTIAIHNGKEAGQEIPHTHIHIIPRKHGDGGGPVHSLFVNRAQIDSPKMANILNKIKEVL